MSKTVIMICMSIGTTLGALLPVLWGDHNLMGGVSIVWGLVGGIVGIVAGVKLSKQLS